MNLMMSNCFALLSPANSVLAAAGQSLGTAPKDADPMMYGFLGAGIVVLIVLTIRRICWPQKFTLKGTPGRPNRVNPAFLLAPLLAVALVQALFGTFFPKQLDHTGSLDSQTIPIKLIAVAAMQFAWLATALVIAYAGFPLGLARGLGLSARHWIYDSLRAVVAVLAVLPMTSLALVVSQWLMGQQKHEMLQILERLPQLGLQWKLLLAFSAIVLAPVTEEIFFRGLCQSVLRKYLKRPWAAVLITAALFAAMHATSELPALPALMILGIVLGYNYERTGRLWAPILIHSMFNALSIVAAWRAAG
jgi:membrane protease YdiL (CAAX protease family)